MKSNQADEEKVGGNYPYQPLAICLPVVDAIKTLGGSNTPVSKALLASSLKEDEKSQTLQFKLASAKSFGMIDGRTSFYLTEMAKRYYFPTDESDRQNALLDFLEFPPAFKKLVERLDGSKLPPVDIIGNILHTAMGVPRSWKDRVAGFFVRSAQFASAIDEQGHLRVKASREGRIAGSVLPDENKGMTGREPGESQPEVQRFRRVAGHLNVAPKVWTFTDDNRTLLVETPRDLTAQEWEVLNQYVQFIAPNGKNK